MNLFRRAVSGPIPAKVGAVSIKKKTVAAAAALALALSSGFAMSLTNAPSASAAYGDVDEAGAIDADIIADGVITNATQLSSAQTAGKDVVSGRAQIVTPKAGGQLTATYNGFEPLAATIPVYLQWIDSDGAVSPIYKATTHDLRGAAGSGGPGTYAFKLPTWKDATGKEHRFETKISQRYRVFTEAAPTNPKTGNPLKLLRAAPGGAPDAFDLGSGSGLGEFPGAIGTNGNMQRTALWFYEEPATDYMKSKNNVVEDNRGPLDNPVSHYDETSRYTFSGKVWLDRGKDRQLFTGVDGRGDPEPSPGYHVWASTLTAEGQQAYESEVNTLPESEQAVAAKKLMTEHPEYIAVTVKGPVAENGRYTLRFPEGDYVRGPGGGSQKYAYMWVTDPEGNTVTSYSTFTQPEFMEPNHNNQWTPSCDVQSGCSVA